MMATIRGLTIAALLLPAVVHGQRNLIGGRAVEAWLEELRRGDTREQAEKALREGGTNTIAILLEMIFAKDTPEEREAFEISDRKGFEYFGFTPKVYNLHMEARFGFGALGTNAIAAIPEFTKLFLDFRTYNDGIWLMRDIGAAAVSSLANILEHHTNTDYRMGAAVALGLVRFDAAPAIPALVKALGDADTDVRANAAHALGNIRVDRSDIDSSLAIEALMRVLSDESSRVRKAAADSLMKFRTEARDAVGALLRASRDDDADVAYAAAIALAYIDPQAGKRVVPILLEAAREGDWTVANSAVSLLREIAPDEAAKARLEIKDPFKQNDFVPSVPFL
jgi:hypothetical protein